MTETELQEYATKKLKSGYPSGELKTELLELGFTEQQIDTAFVSQATSTKPNSIRVGGWIISGVIFFILGFQQSASGNKWGYLMMVWGAFSAMWKLLLPPEK